ncbi:endonuclease/exonuclease/phosphatase family protein [Georgenia alba]|uniref:Endonuclease/exonuclease/phosphatase family protein n=1 Tax=Georgenia alba TaxID=2233858 RepID=A0ABW2QB79_9MICO
MATIGTWNLENLFRPGEDGGPSGETEYDAKLDTLAATIESMDPDVLMVQEVGTPEALDDLAERVGGRWYTELAEPDGRGIRVGAMFRPAAGAIEQITDFPDGLRPIQVDDSGTRVGSLGRAGLHVRVRLGGETVDIVTAHLKSKLLTFPGGRFNPRDEDERARYANYALHRRAAEAAGVRAYVTALLEGEGQERAVVVAGDLNDEVQAATTQILLGPPGSEIGTGGHDRPDAGDGMRLWNLAPLIPTEHRYSRVYRGRRELIDHVLVSHAVLDVVEEVTTAGPGETPSITDTPTERQDEPGSDHRPVVVTLEL